jgi:hypothetical protein
VNRDVVVQRIHRDELIIISREPAVHNDRMLVQLADDDARGVMQVRVLECKPAVVRGGVRYVLRLRVLGTSAADDQIPISATMGGGDVGNGGFNE